MKTNSLSYVIFTPDFNDYLSGYDVQKGVTNLAWLKDPVKAIVFPTMQAARKVLLEIWENQEDPKNRQYRLQIVELHGTKIGEVVFDGNIKKSEVAETAKVWFAVYQPAKDDYLSKIQGSKAQRLFEWHSSPWESKKFSTFEDALDQAVNMIKTQVYTLEVHELQESSTGIGVAEIHEITRQMVLEAYEDEIFGPDSDSGEPSPKPSLN
jgi:hypothetical protein